MQANSIEPLMHLYFTSYIHRGNSIILYGCLNQSTRNQKSSIAQKMVFICRQDPIRIQFQPIML